MGQLERIQLKEIYSNPLLSNMKKHVERDPSLAKASFYVPKGSLSSPNSSSENKMVPVIVRRPGKETRTEEEMSTGEEESFENSHVKSKSPQSKAICPQVFLSKNSKRFSHVTTELLDERT